MIFLRSEIEYEYCTLSENSISEVFQRFKSDIFNFVFLFHEKSVFLSFCLTTLMVHNFLLVTEHLWKTPEMEFSDRVDIVLKKFHRKILIFRKVTAKINFVFFCRKFSPISLPGLVGRLMYNVRELELHGKFETNPHRSGTSGIAQHEQSFVLTALRNALRKTLTREIGRDQ